MVFSIVTQCHSERVRRFGRTYGVHIQVQILSQARNHQKQTSAYSSILKLEAIYFSETSGSLRTTRRYNREYRTEVRISTTTVFIFPWLLIYIPLEPIVKGQETKGKVVTLSMEVVPQLRRSVPSLPPRPPGFEPRLGHVGFVADKVTLGQVFSEYFGFLCQSLFHQLLHNHPHLSSGSGTIGQ
jgi:hypothetical protein